MKFGYGIDRLVRWCGEVVRGQGEYFDRSHERGCQSVSAWRTGYFYFENMSMEELVVS
ncbi:MAG: hypothetical protein ACLUDU_10785 [Butyricimonas faecihominis]